MVELKKALVKDYQAKVKRKLKIIAQDGEKYVEADFLNYCLKRMDDVKEELKRMLMRFELTDLGNDMRDAVKGEYEEDEEELD